MREVLEMPEGCGLVAEIEGAVQGYLLARSVADTAEILNLAVAPPIAGWVSRRCCCRTS